jgi:hypothetical protein
MEDPKQTNQDDAQEHKKSPADGYVEGILQVAG